MIEEYAIIPTNILNEKFWNEKPFQKSTALVDIYLLSANEYGYFETTERNLSERWGWSKTKVRTFLDDLEEEGKIRPRKNQEKNQKRTRITPVNSTVCDKSETKKRPEKKPEKDQENSMENVEICKRIIEYLNSKCGTNYRFNSTDTKKHINARLNEGYSEADFFTVIDKKCRDWIGTEHEKYLRPITLFGTKFECYLNQVIIKKEDEKYSQMSIDWTKV